MVHERAPARGLLMVLEPPCARTFVAGVQAQRRHVLAIKGANTAGKAIWPLKPSKTNKHGVKLFTIGTDTAKDAIFSPMSGDLTIFIQSPPVLMKS